MPKTKQFNAIECLSDIKLNQAKAELSDIESLSSHKDIRQHVVTKFKIRPESGHMEEEKSHPIKSKVVEYYSPLYLASLVGKEGVNQNEETV